jgi:hypothetical protein
MSAHRNESSECESLPGTELPGTEVSGTDSARDGL